MENLKITRVSIFIDYDNFTINYRARHHKKPVMILWDKLVPELLDFYQRNLILNKYEILEPNEVRLCVGLSDVPVGDEGYNLATIYRPLDRKPGFIMKYGCRLVQKNELTQRREIGKEKGVDSEIICQMLMGAFLNHYDSCILLSDDSDYIPVITRIQDYFGKKVIQAGFKDDSKIREIAYAHIPLESDVMDFEKLILRLPTDVLFQLDEAKLDDIARKQIDFVVKKLSEDNKLNVKIHGHTDSDGQVYANEKLSLMRAESVAEYIISKGISKDRIEHFGHGSKQPIASNLTPEDKQKNRRVEFEFI